MVGGLHTSGYLLVWTIHYLTQNQDVYHNLVKEMRERVGSDQQGKLKDYAYDPNTYVRLVIPLLYQMLYSDCFDPWIVQLGQIMNRIVKILL